MDTTKLVVGQELWANSGVTDIKVKVVKITPEGFVHVEPEVEPEMWDTHPWNDNGLIHFDREGISRDGTGTFEGGLWELSLTPRWPSKEQAGMKGN
jgi:hypothetical protein